MNFLPHWIPVGVCCLAFSLLAPSLARGQATGAWHHSYDAALQQAKEEGKDLMVVFTGSDWIDICEEFETKILSQEAFVAPVSQRFVLMKFEIPRGGRYSDPVAGRKMDELRHAYRVRGFPTVVFTDVEGRPFGINGFQDVEAQEYAEMAIGVAEARKAAQEAAVAANDLEGVEKARAIVTSLPVLPGSMGAQFYADEMKQVVALDPNEQLQATTIFKQLLSDAAYTQEMQKLSQSVQWTAMLLLTEKYIEDNQLQGAPLQKALLNKANVYRLQGNTEMQVKTLLDVSDIDGNTPYGVEARKHLEMMRANRLEGTLPPANPE